jgi:single-strand DNA-binding protein
VATFICTGRIGKDAELKKTSGGTEVCSWSMAYDTGYGDKRQSHWVKCAVFGKRAASLAPILLKGKLVEVVGVPVVATWKDKKTSEPRAQIEVSVLEVTLHGGGKSEDDRPVADQGRATSRSDMDSDIPF